jgi:hypothetical protein
MAPTLSLRQRTLIIWRLSQKVPQRIIAQEVPCAQSTVSNIGRKWLRDREIEPKVRPGKRRKTTEEEDNRIIEAGIHYKFNSVHEMMAKIRDELNLNIEISRQTFNRRLIGKEFLGKNAVG